MLRWILPVVLSVLGALGLAWLFGTKKGTRARRQLTKQGQRMLEQGERTFAQVSRQVQGGAQDLLKGSRQLVNHVSR